MKTNNHSYFIFIVFIFYGNSLLAQNVYDLVLDTHIINHGSWTLICSENVLPEGEDGWIEYIIDDGSDRYAVGFNLDGGDPINPPYMFDATPTDGFMDIRDNVTPSGIFNQLPRPSTNTALKIERLNSMINYYIDGQLTFSAPAVADGLRANISYPHEPPTFISIKTSISPCMDTLQLEGTSLADTYQANDLLVSKARVDQVGLVTYNSGAYLVLENGFYTKTGANFQAFIADCNTTEENIESTKEPITNRTIVEHTSKEAVNLQIAPNPSNGWVQISYELAKDQLVSLIIFDINGRLIQKLKDYEMGYKGLNKLDLSTKLNKGIYFISLNNKEINEYKKMIIF